MQEQTTLRLALYGVPVLTAHVAPASSSPMPEGRGIRRRAVCERGRPSGQGRDGASGQNRAAGIPRGAGARRLSFWLEGGRCNGPSGTGGAATGARDMTSAARDGKARTGAGEPAVCLSVWRAEGAPGRAERERHRQGGRERRAGQGGGHPAGCGRPPFVFPSGGTGRGARWCRGRTGAGAAGGAGEAERRTGRGDLPEGQRRAGEDAPGGPAVCRHGQERGRAGGAGGEKRRGGAGATEAAAGMALQGGCVRRGHYGVTHPPSYVWGELVFRPAACQGRIPLRSARFLTPSLSASSTVSAVTVPPFCRLSHSASAGSDTRSKFCHCQLSAQLPQGAIRHPDPGMAHLLSAFGTSSARGNTPSRH